MGGAPRLRSRQLSAVLGSVLFLAVAPGTVAGLVPWWITRWQFQLPLLDIASMSARGSLVIASGLAILLESFARFAVQGLGTPAPVFPTRRLVVEGFYRYVRNPIYLAVEGIVLGQGLLFGDTRLFAYGALLWLGFHVF